MTDYSDIKATLRVNGSSSDTADQTWTTPTAQTVTVAVYPLTRLERFAATTRRPRLRALADVLLDLGFNW